MPAPPERSGLGEASRSRLRRHRRPHRTQPVHGPERPTTAAGLVAAGCPRRQRHPGPDTIVFAQTVHQVTADRRRAGDHRRPGHRGPRRQPAGRQRQRRQPGLRRPGRGRGHLRPDNHRRAGRRRAPASPSTGGGILNQGQPDPRRCRPGQTTGPSATPASSFTPGRSSTCGGAIGGGLANFGTLTVTGCTFSREPGPGCRPYGQLRFPRPPGLPRQCPRRRPRQSTATPASPTVNSPATWPGPAATARRLRRHRRRRRS